MLKLDGLSHNPGLLLDDLIVHSFLLLFELVHVVKETVDHFLEFDALELIDFDLLRNFCELALKRGDIGVAFFDLVLCLLSSTVNRLDF